MISYVLPTRDRPAILARTLAALGALPPHAAELIVVDNASALPPALPIRLANGIPVNVVFGRTNAGAAARNRGAALADRASAWVVMLDDDSRPLDLGFLAALREAPADVAAIAAEITLPAPHHRRREAGGLPEVFIGCGVAIRRDALADCGAPWGGYDPRFDYYAEEYDLAARMLLGGRRILLDRRFRVAHHKVAAGRDMDRILRRLVRNNGWVMQRYAPRALRAREVRHVIARYGRIAHLEKATLGYARGLVELLATAPRQQRSPMPLPLFERFTGLAEARASLQQQFTRAPFKSAAIVDAGKNENVVRAALRDLGVRVTSEHSAEALVIGTLSPGPLLDAWERRTHWAQPGGGGPRILTPWLGLVAPPAAMATPVAAAA